MFTKRSRMLIIPLLLVAMILLTASVPLQADEEGWRGVFQIVILLVVALLGAPITQAIKKGLSALFGKPIEDRWALALSAVIASGVAVLEMWLSHQLDFGGITLDNFPMTFFAVFAVAQLYYGWFKGSVSKFGKGFLLKSGED